MPPDGAAPSHQHLDLPQLGDDVLRLVMLARHFTPFRILAETLPSARHSWEVRPLRRNKRPDSYPALPHFDFGLIVWRHALKGHAPASRMEEWSKPDFAGRRNFG